MLILSKHKQLYKNLRKLKLSISISHCLIKEKENKNQDVSRHLMPASRAVKNIKPCTAPYLKKSFDTQP